MTPYKENKKVIIDPVLDAKTLFFGTLPKLYLKLKGVIKKVEYLSVKKSMTYLVEFENGESHWFIEKELISS